METAYAQYTDILSPPPDRPPHRLTTYLLRARDEWDRFSRRFYPQRYNTYARISYGGYAEQDTAVLYYDSQRAYTLSVMAHEGWHQYLYSVAATPIPAWLNEGLACYCEAFEMQDETPVFTPRRNTFRLNHLREALAGNGLIPLREILATDAGRVLDQNKARPYYAQVWALAVYLRHGERGKYAAGLERLLADLVAGELTRRAGGARLGTARPADVSPGEAVFIAYISDDLDEFERGFQAFAIDLAAY